MIDGMRVIDAHCHIGRWEGERQGLRDFSAEEMLARMEKNGVDHAVIAHSIFPIWIEEEIRRGNDYVIAAAERYPDRFTGMVATNPRHGASAVEEVRRGLAAGAKAIKLHPGLLGPYHVDGALMEPFMRLAATAGVPVVTHSDFNQKGCTPYQVANLAARYPDVTVVLLHLGMDGPSIGALPGIAAPHPNLVVETSNTPDYPYDVFVAPTRTIGADRVMFGSDGPTVSVEVALTKLAVARATYGLTDDEARAILGTNAARVFAIT